MALACIKYANARKGTTMYQLGYLAALAVLVPMAKVLAELMKGANKLLIGVTILAVYLAVITIANRIWEAKEDKK